jgi:hypothetical protein
VLRTSEQTLSFFASEDEVRAAISEHRSERSEQLNTVLDSAA